MSDLISREQAIDALSCENPTETYIDYDDAVKAIRRLPSAQPDKDINVPNTDCISRQDAIRIVDSIDTWQAGWRGNAIESLKAMPSAEPETHEKRTETHACDYISRQAAIMHFVKASKNYECGMFDLKELTHELWQLPSAQSEITECPMCIDCPDNCPLEVEHDR